MKKIFSPWRTQYIEGLSDSKLESSKTFLDIAIESTDDKAHWVVDRRKHCIILMNKFPYNNGHLLIAPNRKVDDIVLLDDNEYEDINNAIRDSIKVIKKIYNPDGYNLGVNAGEAAGAGLPEHLHYHIVPRWSGDTNFMPTLADVKIVSVSMEDSWEKFSKAFKELKA